MIPETLGIELSAGRSWFDEYLGIGRRLIMGEGDLAELNRHQVAEKKLRHPEDRKNDKEQDKYILNFFISDNRDQGIEKVNAEQEQQGKEVSSELFEHPIPVSEIHFQRSSALVFDQPVQTGQCAAVINVLNQASAECPEEGTGDDEQAEQNPENDQEFFLLFKVGSQCNLGPYSCWMFALQGRKHNIITQAEAYGYLSLGGSRTPETSSGQAF